MKPRNTQEADPPAGLHVRPSSPCPVTGEPRWLATYSVDGFGVTFEDHEPLTAARLAVEGKCKQCPHE